MATIQDGHGQGLSAQHPLLVRGVGL